MPSRKKNKKDDWYSFYKKWSNCKKCHLHQHINNYVVCEFDSGIPKEIDVLFIGEAPGPSEDLIGRPFIGPAGKVLRSMIADIKKSFDFSYAITNTVACIPWDFPFHEDRKFRVPIQTEVNSCKERLEKIVELAKPIVIVLLGKVAQNNLNQYVKDCFDRGLIYDYLGIFHPSYILRNGGINSVMYKKVIDELKEIIESSVIEGRSLCNAKN